MRTIKSGTIVFCVVAGVVMFAWSQTARSYQAALLQAYLHSTARVAAAGALGCDSCRRRPQPPRDPCTSPSTASDCTDCASPKTCCGLLSGPVAIDTCKATQPAE